MEALKRLPNPQLYTVGWITALDKELTAAQAVLDEEHQRPDNFRKHPKDTNNYVWGRVGNHNVVIASLAAGKYGTVSAATTAWSMVSSLSHLRFGLMVGIGAGIPRLADNIDIRLGDVVVSQPTGTSPGVVQYDLGKLEDNGQFKRVGSLASPPEVLLKGLAALKAKRRLRGSQVRGILNDMLQRHPLLAESEQDDPAFVYQGAQNDRLFEASSIHIQHPDQQTAVSSAIIVPACMYCDPQKEIERRVRRSTEPVVHYGVIASGNSVLKDGVSRDEIVQRLGDKCICFEMEAAGLMDNFPCLVVRGICDYADTHKNDRWQNYSAATAAAFAKELLGVIDSEDVEGASRIDEIMEQLYEDVSQIRLFTNGMQKSQHFQEVMKWLAPPDPSTNDNKALQQHYVGTGQWFLESEEYSRWKTTPKSSLWLHGIPGCGKTILSSTVIKDLGNTKSFSESLLYFYFDFTDTSKQSLEKAIRSLIAQLYHSNLDVQTHLDSLYSSCKIASRQPNIDSLISTFGAMAQQMGEVWIVLDALDECQTRTGPKNEGLLQWVESILNLPQVNAHLLVTSRPEHDIKSALEKYINNQIPLRSDLVTEDIRAYVHGTVRQHEGFKRWRTREKILDEIESHLMEKANGMFRWVSCQLDALEKCPDPLSLRQTLQSLPRTLDETYSRVLSTIPPQFEQNAKRLLQFLTFSERPLRIEEAVDVITVVTTNKPRFNTKNRMPQPEEISIYCSSLVAVVTRASKNGENEVKELQLAHFSVKEYLISDRLEQNISGAFKELLARASIAEVCLSYLLDLDHCLSLPEIGQSYPLAQYAARYWMSHAIQAKTGGVLQLIREFCLNKESSKTCYRLYNIDMEWGEERESLQKEETPVLYYISQGGIVYAVKELLRNGADIHAQGGRFAASYRGHNEILLNKGADIQAQGGHFSNALQAASCGVVQMLLGEGADIQAQGGRFAASYRGHKEGANIQAQGGHLGNALQAASYRGHKEVVQLLLDKGANIQAQGGHLGNALQAASFGGHRAIVQILLSKGADIQAQGGHYINALHAASYQGQKEVVQLLLDKGANLQAQGGHLGNALQAASFRGHREIVQMLLNGATYGNVKRTYRSAPTYT
ncbi:LOW QUALITY PROTEIN: pfs domain-containing protein [Colletotrichum cereale]|nr:LOW QUALITY PROTEIN: pfs domain-containing protein [Colletotrichum cereale]